MKSIFAIFMFFFIAIPLQAGAVTPDTTLEAITGCNDWNSKGGKACDFTHGNHEFRVWKPNVLEIGQKFKVDFKLDHKLARRFDDHIYVSVISKKDKCHLEVISEVISGSTLGLPLTNYIGRKFDEKGWKDALGQILSSIEFAYCP